MLIRISGRATVTLDGGKPLTAAAKIKKLDGAKSKELCADFLDADLADLSITGGAVALGFHSATGEWRVVTEYSVPNKLKPAQLKRLAAATVGQWSDGIGEACFDELAERLKVTIDLAPEGDPDLRVESIDDGRKPSQSKTALAKAARDGDLPAVRKLLDAGADPETRLQGFTALNLAVLYGSIDAALELIARGADIGAENPAGDDPLMGTALTNALGDADAARIARALLERGADPHSPRGKGGGNTPLFMAKNRKKTALAKVLREYGATK